MFERMIYISFQILIYAFPNVKQLMFTMNEEFLFPPPEELKNLRSYFKTKQMSEKPHIHKNAVILRSCHIIDKSISSPTKTEGKSHMKTGYHLSNKVSNKSRILPQT